MREPADAAGTVALHAAPVAPSERLEVLDVVRGVALLGILAAR
jgi:uncharacterized membrane protein YeiB